MNDEGVCRTALATPGLLITKTDTEAPSACSHWNLVTFFRKKKEIKMVNLFN